VQPAPGVPEILVITVDTLRADRLGFAGHTAAHTPNLDALAHTGRWFSQATTPLPRTTPALASLHTGLWPHHHGAREVGDTIGPADTVASRLAAAGWRTLAASAMQVAGPEQGMDRGFDTFHLAHDARADDLTSAALAMVRSDRDRPTFLWVHYADPHFPYLPPAGGPLNPDAPRCRRLIEAIEDRRIRRAAVYADRSGRASDALADCRQLYDAEIAAVDHAIGTLLAEWRRARGTDGWTVLSADHGENQGEDGLFYEHGPNVHDASLVVPLVIAGPGVQPGRDDGVARLEDLLPTALGWAGVAPPQTLDGVDLRPRLAGGEGGPTLAFAESGSALHATLFDYVVSGRARMYCVNGPRYSLCRSRRGEQTLHDQRSDPDLKHDLSATLPQVVAELQAVEKRWPPESARQRTVRSAHFKLVATPHSSGEYRTALYDLSDPAGRDVSDEQPEVLARLLDAMDVWDAPTPQTGAERSDEELQMLRELGYVE